MKKLCAILLFTPLMACRPLPYYWTIPEGPPEYVQGYEDGCDTGIGAAGGIWHKWYYGFKKDPSMLNNGLYKQGWNEGFGYCRFTFPTTGTFFGKVNTSK